MGYVNKYSTPKILHKRIFNGIVAEPDSILRIETEELHIICLFALLVYTLLHNYFTSSEARELHFFASSSCRSCSCRGRCCPASRAWTAASSWCPRPPRSTSWCTAARCPSPWWRTPGPPGRPPSDRDGGRPREWSGIPRTWKPSGVRRLSQGNMFISQCC